jgi:hypothetical protein
MQNPLEQIQNKITGSDKGTMFVASDFSNIANNEVIRKGLSRQWTIQDISIKQNYKKFKRTANKDIAKLSYKSALLVQAIKAIGSERLDESHMKKIAKLMTADEKQKILTDGQYMTSWVYEAIKTICNEGAAS